MTIEIRSPSAEEWRAAMLTTMAVFADEPRDDDFDRWTKTLVRERFYAA